MNLLIALLMGIQGAELPQLTPTYLYEQRNRKVAKGAGVAGFERCEIRLDMTKIQDVRSYGNLNITKATTNTGVNLIRGPKDNNAFFGTTNIPTFRKVSTYQTKSGKIRIKIILNKTPREATILNVQGSVDVLLGGKTVNVDFAGLQKLQQTKLVHKKFQEGGLRLRMKRFYGQSRFTMIAEGNNSIVSDISVVDKTGKTISSRTSVYTWGRRPDETEYTVNCPSPIPVDAKLRVTIFEGGKLQSLPIQLNKVKLQ
ncbi:MAG: hypothetical protein ACFCD0_25255 [Gemmataceae bacterium]